MIELYCEPNSPDVTWIEAELREMVVGYERRLVTPEQAQQLFGAERSLPVLRDGGRIASGREDLMVFLKDLAKFAEEWRLFQSDSCYIRDDGDTC